MKRRGLLLILILPLLAGLFILLNDKSFAAHSGGNVLLLDQNEHPLGRPLTKPLKWYSPKKSCGTTNCHEAPAFDYGMNVPYVYEDWATVALATKDHGPGTTPYQVPYPLHGVSAGFHFQQGRGEGWGNVQRSYYGLPSFTSAPGMYGNFFSGENRQLADLNESNPGHFDMGSYDFANSPCAWCHPGGGPLEYDRDGYRYDGLNNGDDGLGFTGANPNPKSGDYFSFDVASGNIVSKAAAWQSGGVAEVDCLICHFTRQYSNLERNYAPVSGLLKYMPSLGLTGANGQSGLLTIQQKGGPNINPLATDTTKWVWNNIGAGVATVPGTAFDKTPPKENCAVCHFPDSGWTAKGPSNINLGYTAYQNYNAPGTVPDGDKASTGNNDTAWNTVMYRADGMYRGESINDANNQDAHMDNRLACADCHYLLGEPRYLSDGSYNPNAAIGTTFPPVTDSKGNVVQPSVTVTKIDHQFAKGNNTANVMDPLDNTVSCESCHTTRTNPNLVDNGGTLNAPTPAHTGLPSFHLNVIDCRTCHIPSLSGPVKQLLVDYTAGPYQNGFRGQLYSGAAPYKPLVVWRAGQHDGTQVKLTPTTPMAVAMWANLEADGTLTPIIQRNIKAAAEGKRAGSGTTGGIYNWPLNRPQGGDTSLIVNTQAEITDMVTRLRAGGSPQPVMTFDFNDFVPSHNVATKASGRILGSPIGGSCVMCHSSNDPTSSNYSIFSSGIFTRSYTLYNQPAEGGGLIQTAVDGVNRVASTFPVLSQAGAWGIIDLGNSNGQTVGNTISQGQVLGFPPDYLALLSSPGAAGISLPQASLVWTTDATVSRKVNFDASGSRCAGGNCTFAWDFNGDGITDATTATASYTYPSAGSYVVTLTVSDPTYGLTYKTTATVQANVVYTPPTASKTVSQAGWTVTVVDNSTDSNDAQSALLVTVDWGNATSTTQVGGTTFTKTYTTAGNYTIKHTVTNTGHVSSSSPNVTLPVPVKYAVSGKVTKADLVTPISGALVSLKQGGGTKYIASTATDGTFSITGVVPGSYTVSASRSGYTFTVTPTINIINANIINVSVNSVQ